MKFSVTTEKIDTFSDVRENSLIVSDTENKHILDCVEV